MHIAMVSGEYPHVGAVLARWFTIWQDISLNEAMMSPSSRGRISNQRHNSQA